MQGADLRRIDFRAENLAQAARPAHVHQGGQAGTPQIGVDQQRPLVGLGVANGQVGQGGRLAVARFGAGHDDLTGVGMRQRQSGSQRSEALAGRRSGHGMRHQRLQPGALRRAAAAGSSSARAVPAGPAFPPPSGNDRPARPAARPSRRPRRGRPIMAARATRLRLRRNRRVHQFRRLDHRHAHVLAVLPQIERADLVEQDAAHVFEAFDFPFEQLDRGQLAAEVDGLGAGGLKAVSSGSPPFSWLRRASAAPFASATVPTRSCEVPPRAVGSASSPSPRNCSISCTLWPNAMTSGWLGPRFCWTVCSSARAASKSCSRLAWVLASRLPRPRLFKQQFAADGVADRHHVLPQILAVGDRRLDRPQQGFIFRPSASERS